MDEQKDGRLGSADPALVNEAAGASSPSGLRPVAQGEDGSAPSAIVPYHDPNWEWGRQYVEITLQIWAHSARYSVSVGGNCRGADILEAAIDQLASQLYFEAEDNKTTLRVTLRDAHGGTLLVENDDDDDAECWLRPMIVGIRIVGYRPPTQNAARKRNGAAPVAGGDSYPPPVGWVGCVGEILPAQGIEAGTADTVADGIGAQHESPIAAGDASNISQES